MACNRNEASFTVLHVLFRILQPKPDQVTGDASLPPPKHWPIKFSESCGVGNRRIEGTAKCFEYGTRLTDAVFQSASESRPGIACVRFLSRANKSERKKEGEREREREKRERQETKKGGTESRKVGRLGRHGRPEEPSFLFVFYCVSFILFSSSPVVSTLLAGRLGRQVGGRTRNQRRRPRRKPRSLGSATTPFPRYVFTFFFVLFRLVPARAKHERDPRKTSSAPRF